MSSSGGEPLGSWRSQQPPPAHSRHHPDNMARQRSMSEIIAQYQPILRKYEKDEDLILNRATEEPGTKDGENYMSIVYRIMVEGKRGNGKTYSKSLMRKVVLEDKNVVKIARTESLFHIEGYFYQKVLPLLGPYGPECILAKPREIIMEDLSARDFTISDRRNMLDLEHCVAVIKTLASMHASSLKLKLESPETFGQLVAPLRENIFPADGEASIGTFLKDGVNFALRSLKSINNRTPEVQRAIDFISNHSKEVSDIMENMLKPQSNDNKYWVITHGDTWNNNIMFLHGSDGRVARVKLVDFQIVRHASPAIDFTYFLYTSAHKKVLHKYFNDLIQTYESFLVNELRGKNVSDNDLKPFMRAGWFKSQIKQYGLFGFLCSLMLIEVIFLDPSRATELKMNMLNSNYSEGSSIRDEITEEKTDRILFIVNHYLKNVVDDDLSASNGN